MVNFGHVYHVPGNISGVPNGNCSGQRKKKERVRENSDTIGVFNIFYFFCIFFL